MKKTMIVAVAILGLAGAGIWAATLFPPNSDERVQQNSAHLQSASFAVENMTCATCPITVRRAMEGVARGDYRLRDQDGDCAVRS